jgi:hypothetical protein
VRLDWKVPDGWVAGIGTTVEIHGLALLPDDHQMWVREVLERELPAGAVLEIRASEDGATTHGWPMRTAFAQVVDADGAVREARVAFFFLFHEHGGAVVARGLPPDRAEEVAAVLRPAALAAAPDWRGTVASLADLWDAGALTALVSKTS